MKNIRTLTNGIITRKNYFNKSRKSPASIANIRLTFKSYRGKKHEMHGYIDRSKEHEKRGSGKQQNAADHAHLCPSNE